MNQATAIALISLPIYAWLDAMSSKIVVNIFIKLMMAGYSSFSRWLQNKWSGQILIIMKRYIAMLVGHTFEYSKCTVSKTIWTYLVYYLSPIAIEKQYVKTLYLIWSVDDTLSSTFVIFFSIVMMHKFRHLEIWLLEKEHIAAGIW